LYTWKQIRKLQLIYRFNQHNDFVPIAIYAPSGGCESHYGGSNDYYGWYGKQSPYYARMLWESARKRLANEESEALAFDIVEASECFNTIRFRKPDKVREYCAEFRRIMRSLAENGEVKCAIGRAPARPHPWDSLKRLEEVIISDNAEYKPNVSHDPKFDNTIPEYRETAPLEWGTVEKYFVELTEDELTFLHGDDVLNKSPNPLDYDLIEACKKLDTAGVEAALKAGANPNSTTGGRYAEGLISLVMTSINDFDMYEATINNVYEIVDLLITYGVDIDFCPYCEGTPLYCATYHDARLIKFILEKGANPNTISWIGLNEIPATPLDSIADDINAYGKSEDLNESFRLIDDAGGKYFSEIVPDFYDDE
jgi:hypothetical protein